MSSFNLMLQLRKDRADRLGKCQIRIRAVLNGKSKYVGTGIKIHPNNWDSSNQRIKHIAPNAGQLNFKLSDLKLNYERELLNVERMTGSITEAKMDQVLAKENSYDFHKYAERYFKNFSKQFKEETLKTYRYDLEKLQEFRRTLLISDWTPEFVAKYHHFMVNVRGNSQNTCNKALKPIKKVLRHAREVDHLIKDDPFKVYNISKEETIPVYLEQYELAKLWDILVNNPLEMHPTLRMTGLYFMLSCYTGLRYSDLAQVHNSNIIKDNRISLTMVKGQDPLRLPLLKEAIILLKLIGDKKVISNQKGNEYLKVIQKLAGIKKDLHWHAGRHTLGMMAADNGLDKDVTAVLLGHKSIKSTAIYHRISNQRGNKEVEILQSKLDSLTVVKNEIEDLPEERRRQLLLL